MRKLMGVGAALLLAGAVVAPANATPTVANLAPVSVSQTVGTEADSAAVVTFDSPVVATVAAPVEAVEVSAPTVAPAETVEPVKATAPVTAPVVQTVVRGGTVTETTTEAPVVSPDPVVAPVVESTAPEPPVINPEPPVVAPEPVEVAPLAHEGDVLPFNADMLEFFEYNVNPETGENYAGAYVGTYLARSESYFDGQTGIELHKMNGIAIHPDGNPMGTDVLYVFHVFKAIPVVAAK